MANANITPATKVQFAAPAVGTFWTDKKDENNTTYQVLEIRGKSVYCTDAEAWNPSRFLQERWTRDFVQVEAPKEEVVEVVTKEKELINASERIVLQAIYDAQADDNGFPALFEEIFRNTLSDEFLALVADKHAREEDPTRYRAIVQSVIAGHISVLERKDLIVRVKDTKEFGPKAVWYMTWTGLEFVERDEELHEPDAGYEFYTA